MDPVPQEEEEQDHQTYINGGVNKLEKTGKEEGEGEGERGWWDAGIRLVVQI